MAATCIQAVVLLPVSSDSSIRSWSEEAQSLLKAVKEKHTDGPHQLLPLLQVQFPQPHLLEAESSRGA